MNPGPDLDADVARKVLNIVVLLDTSTGVYLCKDTGTKQFVPVPPYSTDTATAHQLVQLYKNAGCTFNINSDDEGVWTVTISHPRTNGLTFSEHGQTLPHAICNVILQFNGLFKITTV